jgi:hypothetical protein
VPTEATLYAEDARQLLCERLAGRGWSWKQDLYSRCLESVRVRRQAVAPRLSVVIIAWRAHPDIQLNLELLAAQRETAFELIFVDNGAPPGDLDFALPHSEVYVRLGENTGAYLARNLGTVFAEAPILLFLDDDGLPGGDLLAAHLDAFRTYDCTSVRGVCLPKTASPFNNLAKHYHLGDRPFPQYPVIEGNTSFAADIFYRVGGWDDEIRFGGGGFDLARRMIEIDPDMRRQIYHPRPALRHDYVRDQAHLDAKTATQVASLERLRTKLPDFRVWRNVWEKFRDREDLLLRRVDESPAASSAGDRDEPPQPTTCDLLGAKLAHVGWTAQRDALAPAFLQAAIPNQAAVPAISVIIHTAASAATGRCLRRLAEQRNKGIQLITVQPAPFDSDIPQLADTVIEARPGTAANVLRNLGAAFAAAPILLFLEDREIPSAGLLAAHLELHERYDLVAVQGAIRPLTDSTLNREAGHFLPAGQPFPLFADADSNTSYRAESFYWAGGWPGELGPEGAGLALSRAIAAIEPDLRRQIYSPLPWIERDEADDASSLEARRHRFAATRRLLCSRLPDFERFLSCWDSFEGRDDLLPPRGREAAEADARRAIKAYREETDYFAAVIRLRRLINDFPEQLFTTYQLGFWRTLVPPTREEITARRISPTEGREIARLSPSREEFAAAAAAVNDQLRMLPWFETPKSVENQPPLSIFCLKIYDRG